MTRLSVHALHVRLNGRAVLKGVEARVDAGHVIGLIGPNGAGKTTLLKAMAGLLTAEAGEIRLLERPLQSWSRQQLARTLSYLPQGAPCSWPLEVHRVVAFGRLPYLPPWRRPSADDERVIASAMEQADVADLVGRDVLSLSGGERARVMLARALAVEPAVLLADEPIAGLDPAHQLRVMAALRRRAADGMSVVITLHDLTLATRFCDRLILLDHGHLVAEGTPAAVLRADLLASVFGIRVHFGGCEGQDYIIPWEALEGSSEAAPLELRRAG